MEMTAVVPAEATCLGCGYSLRGLESRRCPECGRAYDPADSTTMRVPNARRQRRNITIGGEMLKLAIAATVLPIIEVGLFRSSAWLVVDFATLMWLSLPFAWLWYRFLRPYVALWTPLPPVPRGGSWRLAAALMFIFHCSIWSGPIVKRCPHATYVTIGPVGLAWSDRNGPCRNQAPGGGLHLIGHWYFVQNWSMRR